MKLSLSWLRDWIDVDVDADAIAAALTRRGFYVEGVEHHGPRFQGVVVARVLEVQRHPNADKLSLCRVDGGAGEVRVVCGAPNVHAGMIAPLATVGARLPGGMTIKKSKIRGEESQGMLCSARELELSDDHEGIVDLERYLGERGAAAGDLTVGRPLPELLGPADAVLEVEIPFNRPDGMGVVGLAREVRAAFGGRWSEAARVRLDARWTGGTAFDLAIEDPEGCPRYIAQAIEGVTIGPSPAWLSRRLEAVGQRPINNVVDVTNFVLFELGQPLHAFDLDRLEGPAIRVRRARPGEVLVTLDGKERALDPEILLITDRDAAVAAAGVMGGAHSEVHDGTTRLLLECAWFAPRRIRRGARRLGLSTEASKRFERGVDPGIGPVATARFLELLRACCPGLELGASREARGVLPQPMRLSVRPARATRVIGMPITPAEARHHLESLEFGLTGEEPIEVAVPSWRRDIAIEDDLVEEIARAQGYDLIPEVPLEGSGAHAVRTAEERLRERARRAMLARGIVEACTTTLVAEREAIVCAQLLGADPARLVRVSNPTSREHEVLRPNLIAGLLRACAHNLRQGIESVRLFEIGAGIAWPGEVRIARAPGALRDRREEMSMLPEETPMIAAIVTGARYAHAHDASQQLIDFEDAKGLWEAFLAELGVDAPAWRAYSGDGWKPGGSAEVAGSASPIGWAGVLSQALLAEWGIEQAAGVHVFVARLLPLLAASRATARASLPGRFPPVRRDLAFFVPASLAHRELSRTLAAAAGARLVSLEVFDVYAGPGTPQDMKSMAFALQFQDPERTMTESEVQTIQDRMVAAVAEQCGGRLRER